jgi:hypothetical protein
MAHKRSEPSSTVARTDAPTGAPIVGIDPPAEPGRVVSSESDPLWTRSLNRAVSVQRPVVVAHVARIRRKNPDASPAEIIRILERQYLAAVTGGGAAVGATAVVPGIGWAVSLALSGAETAGFLETSALYAQSITEVHGIAVTDPERAQALVMAMMLGGPGVTLVKQLAGQAGGVGPARTAFWGELVTSSLPKSALGSVTKNIRDAFIKRFVVRQGTGVLGRALPFGIGAVVGGAGNHALGRKIVASSRTAFGPAPASFPIELEEQGPHDARRWGRRRGADS